MELVSTDKWDAAFFEEFSGLRNRIHRQNRYHLTETPGDLAKRFGHDTAFDRHNEWRGWMARKDGIAVARGLVSLPRSDFKGTFAPLGYFESENDLQATSAIFAEAERWARARGKTELRGPIQGNFFTSYRFRISGKGKPFYGEPVVPEYYPALWENAGFEPSGYWDSTRTSGFAQVMQMAAIVRRFWKKSSPRPDDPRPMVALGELRARTPDFGNWSEELKLVHGLFMESYSSMPDFMPMSLEEFQEEYSSFKYIANRRMTWILEYGDRPVAFIIAYFDPLRILLSHQRWQKRIPEAAVRLLEALTFVRLKLNRFRLLLPYAGKVEYPDFQIKGAAALLMSKVAWAWPPFILMKPFNVYLATDSRSRVSIPKGIKIHARYVLYRKSLA